MGIGRTGRRVLGAVGAGLLLSAAFPPVGAWPLAVVAVAGLALLVRGLDARRGALVSLAFGVAFQFVLLDWMRVIGIDAWLALVVLEAAFLAAQGAALAVVSRLPGWPLWAAAIWVGQEALRSRIPFGGLPWGRLAFAETASPFTAYAAIGGAPLVSFATALAGCLLAAAALRIATPPRSPVWAGVVALSALAVPAAALLVAVPSSGDRQVTVALVQGNVPRLGLDFLGQREAVLDNHVAATKQLAVQVQAGRLPKPDVVIWPENASDLDPFTEPEARARIAGAVRAVGVPTLVGAVLDGPDADHVQNSAIVWDPRTGPGARYVKRHPVPFGEYIPFRSFLSNHIGRLQRIPRDFAAGTRPGVLRLGPMTVGDVICFEVAYDPLMRDVISGGAEALVVQTNNATYGRTSQPEQQLAMSRLRAVEHGRSVLVAATSGITAAIAPDGTVLDESRQFTRDIIVRRMPLRTALTVADRVGAVPEALLAIVGLMALVVGVLTSRQQHRRPNGAVARGAPYDTDGVLEQPLGSPEREGQRAWR